LRTFRLLGICLAVVKRIIGGIDITQEMVTKQLSRLRDDKASGPDELVQRFLNEIREGIVQPLTLLFRKVVEGTEVPA